MRSSFVVRLASWPRSTSLVPSPRDVEPNFTGPSYTLGIEEELMILDARDARPRQRDRGAARGRATTTEGEVKPELMESVLRDRHRRRAEHARGGRASCARCAAGSREVAGAARAGDRLGRHAPVRALGGPADRRRAPRYRDLIAALRFVARQEIIFGIHVHVGHRRPRQGDPRRQRDARARAAAARAVGQLAVLARRRRPASPPRARRSSAPSRASGIPPRYDDWDDYAQRIEFMVEARRDRATTPTSGTTSARTRTSARSRSA